MQRVLGIDVDDELYAHWRQWFSPSFQLFRAEQLTPATLEGVERVGLSSVPLEVRDTFDAYGGEWVRVDEATFRALPTEQREELMETRDPHGERGAFRWPSELAAEGDGALIDFMNDGASPSLHGDVAESTWSRGAALLPDARRLAGSFARKSGPNCFGNVMAAAGLPVEHGHVGLADIDNFLNTRAKLITDADLTQPGIVVLWRRERDEPHHTCVTLGDGWVLNKPAQAWWAGRYVWTVDHVLTDNEAPSRPRSTYQLL